MVETGSKALLPSCVWVHKDPKLSLCNRHHYLSDVTRLRHKVAESDFAALNLRSKLTY
jgi:hypothetical protein